MMVCIGGHRYHYLKEVEALDLSGNNDVCSLPDFPYWIKVRKTLTDQCQSDALKCNKK